MFPWNKRRSYLHLNPKSGGRHGQLHQTFCSRQPGIHGASASKQCQLAWAQCNTTRIFTSSSRTSFFCCSLGLHRLARSSSQLQQHEISCTWTLGCAQWALYHMWVFLLSIRFASNKHDQHWHGWNEAKCLLISLCKQRMQMTRSHKYKCYGFTNLCIPAIKICQDYRARTSPWSSSLPSPSLPSS